MEVRRVEVEAGRSVPFADRTACSGNPLRSGSAQCPFEQAPDPQKPFVECGMGQPKGLSVREQVEWMKQALHPHHFDAIDVDEDLMAAVAFECAELP